MRIACPDHARQAERPPYNANAELERVDDLA
jgi:hypothetical protein